MLATTPQHQRGGHWLDEDFLGDKWIQGRHRVEDTCVESRRDDVADDTHDLFIVSLSLLPTLKSLLLSSGQSLVNVSRSPSPSPRRAKFGSVGQLLTTYSYSHTIEEGTDLHKARQDQIWVIHHVV